MQQVIRPVSPIQEDIAYWFCFTGAETEMDKIKDDSKLNGKQISIATVWDLYRMYATFLNTLGSHYRQPLSYNLSLAVRVLFTLLFYYLFRVVCCI